MTTALAPQVARQQLVAALLEKSRRAAGTDNTDLLTWACLYRRLLKPGVPFDLTRHPYLVQIYQQRAPHKILRKASQEGASEYAITYALHGAGVRDATVLYVFPTDRAVSDFSKARLGPALEASPLLAQLVVDSRGKDGKRGSDQVTLKRVGDRFLYFRGAQVQPDGRAPQLKSVDADIVILDELDEMDQRAPQIAYKRINHSDIREILEISTPTYPGIGIDARYQESDQRQWHVQCRHCGERQPLTIAQVVVEWDPLGRPVAWHGMDEGRAWVACRKCGRELERLGPGEWVATYPGRRLVGYHLSKLFSAYKSVEEIVANLQTVDETKRRETYNQDLGLPFEAKGKKLTDAVLDGCRQDYAMGPVNGERPFMGVDVGAELHVVIRAPEDDETGQRPLRLAISVDSFAQALHLLREYNVQTCVVDALPETREARAFQEAAGLGRVWLAYYQDLSKHPEPTRWNDDAGNVEIDRTRSLDIVVGRFYDGVNALPGDIRAVPDYYAHLKAPTRVLVETSKGKVAQYAEGALPDHFAHAENYCAVAATMEAWLAW
ncbi:MAG: phage terminase large subunit family protein [Anaerolineales bacterium]|nr:phage terminase large subunit family protein [Anaerolineales bacterium]